MIHHSNLTTSAASNLEQEKKEITTNHCFDSEKSENYFQKISANETETFICQTNDLPSKTSCQPDSDTDKKPEVYQQHKISPVQAPKGILPSQQREKPRPSKKIYISFLPINMNKQSLNKLFSLFGKIKSIKIGSKPDGFTYAYITYGSISQAKKAIHAMCKMPFGNHFLNVSYAINTQACQKTAFYPFQFQFWKFMNEQKQQTKQKVNQMKRWFYKNQQKRGDFFRDKISNKQQQSISKKQQKKNKKLMKEQHTQKKLSKLSVHSNIDKKQVNLDDESEKVQEKTKQVIDLVNYWNQAMQNKQSRITSQQEDTNEQTTFQLSEYSSQKQDQTVIKSKCVESQLKIDQIQKNHLKLQNSRSKNKSRDSEAKILSYISESEEQADESLQKILPKPKVQFNQEQFLMFDNILKEYDQKMYQKQNK